jgi:hypothetical protein
MPSDSPLARQWTAGQKTNASLDLFCGGRGRFRRVRGQGPIQGWRSVDGEHFARTHFQPEKAGQGVSRLVEKDKK